LVNVLASRSSFVYLPCRLKKIDAPKRKWNFELKPGNMGDFAGNKANFKIVDCTATAPNLNSSQPALKAVLISQRWVFSYDFCLSDGNHQGLHRGLCFQLHSRSWNPSRFRCFSNVPSHHRFHISVHQQPDGSHNPRVYGCSM
jgi:hypothetical protein